MNLISAFKNFQTQYSKDPQTTQKIRRYIETSSNKDVPVERGIAAVEDYIRSLRNRKIKHIMVYLDFVSWLKQNVSDSIQSNFPKDYVTSTRRIELIKYLQEPHSREDITEQLVVNERTLNSDFKALEDGIDVLGCTLKVKFRKYDREGRITVDGCEYHSSCNPVFLPLNMTELFLLTNIIPNYLTNTELCDSYKSILKKIYPQLTDYSLGLMKIEKSDFPDTRSLYKFEYETLLKSHIYQLVYFLKRGEEATFVIVDNGKPKEIKGTIDNFSGDTFIIRNQTGRLTVKIENYLGVKDLHKTYK